MFMFKKIVAPFLLPPGIFILLLVFSAVWFFIKKNWRAGLINLMIGVFIWGASIFPVANAILKGIEDGSEVSGIPNGDVIILLGGGVYGDLQDISGIGIPTEHMIVRITTAVRLQKRLDVPIIVSGGSVFKGKKAEAPIVKRFIADLGVPANKVIIEDKSRDTMENAKYTAEICRKFGYKKPILVTSSNHMKRSIESFEKVGLRVRPFSLSFIPKKTGHYGWEDYMPNAFALKGVSFGLHEHMGLLFYKFAY